MTSQKLGISLIVAALIAIAVIAWVLISDSNKHELGEIRAEGFALVRLLSGFEWAALTTSKQSTGPLEALRPRLGRSALAYVVLADTQGEIRTYIGQESLTERMQATVGPTENWLAERELELASGRRVQEFSAPITQDNEIAGSLRIGFFIPGFALGIERRALVAQIALPVFLLIPLFYYGLRREMMPLRQASQRLDDVAARALTQGESAVLTPSNDLSSFMQNFNKFLEAADAHFGSENERQQDLLIHERIVSYEKNRIEASLRTLPDGILVTDANGRATFVNDNLCKLFGIAEQSILGLGSDEWEFEPAVRGFFEDIKGACNLQRVEKFRFSYGEAPRKTISITALPLFSPGDANDVFGAIIVFRDVTEEVISREARDEFIAHVAHEVKNPLNVINLQAETLAEFGADDPDVRVSSINIIQDEIDRLARLISNLLSITQIESGTIAIDRQTVKLASFLEDAFSAVMRGGEDRDIKPEIKVPKTLPNIVADKDLLRLALNNLLTNAIKYNRDGGTVTLVAEEYDEHVVIKVSDEGFGIAAEEQASIFQKFYRSENAQARAREGHGLGLALAKKVIDLHHGTLSVESEIDHGTTFVITLGRETNVLQEAV